MPKINILRKGADRLGNGILFGIVAGFAAVFGERIIAQIVPLIPEKALILGTLSLPVYIISIFAVAGYIIDRL